MIGMTFRKCFSRFFFCFFTMTNNVIMNDVYFFTRNEMPHAVCLSSNTILSSIALLFRTFTNHTNISVDWKHRIDCTSWLKFIANTKKNWQTESIKKSIQPKKFAINWNLRSTLMVIIHLPMDSAIRKYAVEWWYHHIQQIDIDKLFEKKNDSNDKISLLWFGLVTPIYKQIQAHAHTHTGKHTNTNSNTSDIKQIL